MYQTIPVRYLDAWLEQRVHGRLIDLRTPEEYNVSSPLRGGKYSVLWLQDNRQTLTGERPLLFYCARGVKAFWCAAGMTGWDMRVYNLGGGYRFYQGKYQCSLR